MADVLKHRRWANPGLSLVTSTVVAGHGSR